jgi:hypothetical protein
VVNRRSRNAPGQTLEKLVTETTGMVGQLLRENRALRAENVKLSRELERVSQGWEEVRKLARAAPRRRRAR